MSRTIGAAEAKTHLLRILDELERTGESVTITKRGRPVGELRPVRKKGSLYFGCMAHPDYRFDEDAVDQPAYDQPWNAELGILGDEDDEDVAAE